MSIKGTTPGEATKNAIMRSEELAKNSDSEVGTLKYASQGVFQIVPVNSTLPMFQIWINWDQL